MGVAEEERMRMATQKKVLEWGGKKGGMLEYLQPVVFQRSMEPALVLSLTDACLFFSPLPLSPCWLPPRHFLTLSKAIA